MAGGSGLEKPCSSPQGSFKHLETNEYLRFLGVAIGECSKTVSSSGEVAERLKAPVLKTGVRETVPRVRIPPSPPLL